VKGSGCGGLWKFKFRFSFLGEREEEGGGGESWNNSPSFSLFAAVKEGSCCCAAVLDILRRFNRTHDEYENSRTAPRRNRYVKGEKLCFVSSERTGISTTLTLSLEVENGWPGDILD